MPATGLFYIPPSSSSDTPTFQTLLITLTARYNASPVHRWTLEHRLFRETPSSNTNSSSQNDVSRSESLRYLQVLTLSHHPERTYLAVTSTKPIAQTSANTTIPSGSGGGESTAEPATIAVIPSGNPSEEFLQLMMSKLTPLWSPRQTSQVQNGQGFELGDFHVRIGELRQGKGSVQQGRGVVVEVEWVEAGEEGDWATTTRVIRDFWEALLVKNARECIQVAGLEDGFSDVRQWCEALRLRG